MPPATHNTATAESDRRGTRGGRPLPLRPARPPRCIYPRADRSIRSRGSPESPGEPHPDRPVNHLVQLPDDGGNIRLLPIPPQALVDHVDGAVITAVGVHACDRKAGFEFLEDRPAHHLESLSGLVVLVGGFLGGYDGRVPGKAGLGDDLVQRSAPLVEEAPHEGDGLRQVGQQFRVGPGGVGLAARAAADSPAGPSLP